jgi:uncharacterized protein
MWILLSAVITASLLGSLHCVGMCGPLAIWAAGVDRSTKSASIWSSTTLYHLGRGVTYTLAGIIAGGVGQLLDWSGGSFGIQLLAARIVGGLMIVIGMVSVYQIGRAWLSKLVRNQSDSNPASSLASATAGSEVSNSAAPPPYVAPQPDWMTRQILKLRPTIFKLPLQIRGLVVGLLTALLPCGWLYLFALLAAGTGSIQLGALVMVAFWLGSIPLLVGLVAGSQLFGAQAKRLLPFAASLLLVFAGAYTASGRGFAGLSGLKVSSTLIDQLKSGKDAGTLDAATVQQGIEQLVATPLPCCEATEVQEPGENHATGPLTTSENPSANTNADLTGPQRDRTTP